MSSRDFADNLQQQARTIGLEKIAQLLTAYQKQNEPIEDDAIIQWFMYAPLVDLHDTTIVFGTPNFVEPVDSDMYGLLGYRKFIPDLVDAYDLVHDDTNMTDHTFPKPGNTQFQPSAIGVKFGGAVQFSGASYQLINHVANNPLDFEPRTTALTIAFWFYTPSGGPASEDAVMAKRGGFGDTDQGWSLEIHNRDRFFNFVMSNGTDSTGIKSAVFSANTWHHLVFTKDTTDGRAGMKFYIDKVESHTDIGSAATISGSAKNSLNTGIGALHDGTEVLRFGKAFSWMSIATEEATQAWINADFDGIRDFDTDIAGTPKEITTMPWIDSLAPMPNAHSGMFIGS